MSSISRAGLLRLRVDRRGCSGVGLDVTLGLGVGRDKGIRRRKNLLFLTRTRPLCVLMKYRRCGPISITLP